MWHLSECEEQKALKQAEEAVRVNKDLQDILSSYQTRQRFFQMARMRGKVLSDEDNAELKSLEAKVNSTALIANLLENRQLFQETMKNLNSEISGLLGIDFASNSSTGCC